MLEKTKKRSEFLTFLISLPVILTVASIAYYFAQNADSELEAEREQERIAYEQEQEELVEKEQIESSFSTYKASNDEIYNWMMKKYNELTNNGETYDPEIHDSMVAELASDRFNITESEAGNIYVEQEMQRTKD